MNPLEKVEAILKDIASSQIRSELYLSGMFSIELARLNIIPADQLLEIIQTIHQSIEVSLTQQEQRGAKEWPVKNLAA